MALPYATENQLKLLEQKTKAELDRKTANVNLTANTLEDMNKLVTQGSVNDGQLCYCKGDKKLYLLKDNVWSEVGGGEGIPVVEGTFDESSSVPRLVYTISSAQTSNFILKAIGGDFEGTYIYVNVFGGTYNAYLYFESFIAYLIGSGTEIAINISAPSGLPIVQATESEPLGDAKIYTIPQKQDSPFILSINGVSVLISVSPNGYYGEYHSDYKYYYISGSNTTILVRENTSFVIGSKIIPLFTNYNILVDKQSNKTEILPCTASDNGKVLSVVNGEAQWASASGGALTGEALMNATKDSTTITRTLDTDGKVKLDAKGGGSERVLLMNNGTIEARTWEANVPVEISLTLDYRTPGYGDKVNYLEPVRFSIIQTWNDIKFVILTSFISKRNSNTYSYSVIMIPQSSGSTNRITDVFANVYATLY